MGRNCLVALETIRQLDEFFVVMRAAGAGSRITVFSFWDSHFSALFFSQDCFSSQYFPNSMRILEHDTVNTEFVNRKPRSGTFFGKTLKNTVCLLLIRFNVNEHIENIFIRFQQAFLNTM